MKKKARHFKVVMFELCRPFTSDGVSEFAPAHPGVYELLAFHNKRGEILYVGLAMDSLQETLSAHLRCDTHPDSFELKTAAKTVHFDCVVSSDINETADLKDIAGALTRKHKPRFNKGKPLSSGKYGLVTVEVI